MMSKSSEDYLVAIADCLECLSKDTLFERFRGKLIRDDKTKLAEGVQIIAEVHKCRTCGYEFEKTDGPWIGFTLFVWHEAIKNKLAFSKVIEYTNFIREEED